MKIYKIYSSRGELLFEGIFNSLADAVTMAVVQGVDLQDVDFRGANFEGANLRNANLCSANLCSANLCSANLRGANLCGANLRGATMTGANLTFAYIDGFDVLPNINNPDAIILDKIKNGKGKLLMETWHACTTTHCRAGWYISLSGPAGEMLEAIQSPAVAGAIIFTKAYSGRKIPDFYSTNEDALKDIEANAAL